MDFKTSLSKFIRSKENQISILAVLLIVYSVFVIFPALPLLFGYGIKAFAFILYSMVPYIAIVIISICIIRGKKFGWYGFSIFSMVLVLELIFIIFSLIVFILFKFPMPNTKVIDVFTIIKSPKLYLEIIKGIFGLFLLKSLISDTITKSFVIKSKNKFLLVISILLFTILLIAIYIGGGIYMISNFKQG